MQKSHFKPKSQIVPNLSRFSDDLSFLKFPFFLFSINVDVSFFFNFFKMAEIRTELTKRIEKRFARNDVPLLCQIHLKGSHFNHNGRPWFKA